MNLKETLIMTSTPEFQSNLPTQESSIEPGVLALIAEPTSSSLDFHGLFSGWQWESLRNKMLRAGIDPLRVKFYNLRNLQEPVIPGASAIVGMGEAALRFFTEKRGVDKWQLSPLLSTRGQKFIPTFDLPRINKQYELNLYLELTLRRAFQESLSPEYNFHPENFHLNPGVEETFAILEHIEKTQPEISVDVETGYGQINTVGIAWSASDAIAINVLPDRLSDSSHYELWQRIQRILESDSRKIFQNFSYDVSYFSAYGIRVGNIDWDTMWAMKFLWPELDMNLGNVGRIYTNRSYWKDDGKVEHEEGKKKDWGNIRDWHRHYLYNCRDTTGTWEAKQNQFQDVFKRGMLPLWSSYVRRLAPAILEMSSHGMPLCLGTREKLKAEVSTKVEELIKQIHAEVGFELNPGSSKQKITYLKEQGVKIPKKYDKEKGSYRESADASSLEKIALKHPELKAIPLLTEVATLQKALSSYINFHVKENESIARFSLGKFTETFRFAGGKDPWGRGFNIQTIPRDGSGPSIKSMFVAPEKTSFVEIDLRQAESRFVAYDCADKTLIDMLESNYDVHSHVAREILKNLGKNSEEIPKEEFKKTWRQLGKKAGHGANYSMKANVFMETCFSEMGIVLVKKDAEAILESYHSLFPGIRLWHGWIRNELSSKRRLSTPFGWERYFYGRLDDNMFREAYAFRPQSTIPFVTNQLMLHLMDEREAGRLKFQLLLQGHDALYMLVPEGEEEQLMQRCHELKNWQSGFNLPGGKLTIPVETKHGKVLSETKEYIP